MAVPVTTDIPVPVLDVRLLEEGLGADRYGRLRRVEYEIDLEGLGLEDGTEEFARLIPGEEIAI